MAVGELYLLRPELRLYPSNGVMPTRWPFTLTSAPVGWLCMLMLDVAK